MPARPIVRDDAFLGGQWFVEGTAILVTAIQQDVHEHGNWARALYRSAGLTDEEIEAALAFVMPPVKAPRVDVKFMGMTIHCECGIVRPATVSAPTFETDTCPCGRTWHVPAPSVPTLVAELAERDTG